MWFKRRAQRKPGDLPIEAQELLIEIAGWRAQVDTLFDQIRLAKEQRDRAICKANELLRDRDADGHRFWHPDKEGPYLPHR